jgi:hypothetical protein
MADPSLASTAVFVVSDDQVGAGKLAAKRRRKKVRREMLVINKITKTLSSVPTLRRLGSAVYQVRDRFMPRESRFACIVESDEQLYLRYVAASDRAMSQLFPNLSPNKSRFPLLARHFCRQIHPRKFRSALAVRTSRLAAPSRDAWQDQTPVANGSTYFS